MPKTNFKTPISGLFGVIKPSGKLTMRMLEELNGLLSSSPLFKDLAAQPPAGKKKSRNKWKATRIKLGQGGTLDPLAQGVVVIGTNQATKSLSKFLDCSKEYRTTSILGCATDSYDSDGKVVRYAPFAHVTRQQVEAALDKFRGEIDQVPPIYSALKMDGKALYEYARTNTPLPRPIEARKCTIHSLELVDWQDHPGSHPYAYPTEHVEDLESIKKMEQLVRDQAAQPDAAVDPPVSPANDQEKPDGFPPIFTLKMTVSSGTYVRSIAHDLGLALGSAAHVVMLERTRQGEYALAPSEDPDTKTHKCVDWSVFQKAIEQPEVRVGDELLEWEKAVLEVIDVVDK